jgi:aromatic-L-amino-acid decarboxylase
MRTLALDDRERAAADRLLAEFLDGYGPQLSRAFKAFKVWCALRAFGTGLFRAAIDRTLDLARQLGERIDADPALELMAPVTTTAVCLRIPGVDHRIALATLNDDGIALLGPARYAGVPAYAPASRTTAPHPPTSTWSPTGCPSSEP